jgi:hypothetical protein
MLSKHFEAISQLFLRYQDYVPLWSQNSDISSQRRRKSLIIVGIGFVVIILTAALLFSSRGLEGSASQLVHGGNWTKPAGLTVVALVFYGRRANVQILERYLRVLFSVRFILVG